jgi:hypothetical protein
MTHQPTLPPPATITGPGIYRIPPDEYHARPELSSTGVRRLLPPSCPALFKLWRDQGDEPKKAWDIGSAAHKLVLGVGPQLVVVEGDGKLGPEVWNTDKVRARVAEVRKAGGVPLKPSEFQTVTAMAEALRAHPVASALFTPRGGVPDLGPDGTGEAEITVIWRDSRTGVDCRALIDYLPYFTLVDVDGQPAHAPAYPGRLLIPDYKTTGKEFGASPDAIGRAMSDRGYYVQMAWYLMGLRAVGYARENTQPLLVVQETRPPYLVTVAQPDRDAMKLGEIRCRQALDLFAECTRSGRWRGYSDEVVLAELPRWETRELDGVVW